MVAGIEWFACNVPPQDDKDTIIDETGPRSRSIFNFYSGGHHVYHSRCSKIKWCVTEHRISCFKQPSYVSDEKRKRVEEAIKQLHFTPNQISNHFRLKRTGSIGIIIPYLSHPYFAELAGVLSEESHNYGYKPVLFQTFGDRHQEIDVFEKWKRKELDALIITSSSLNQVELDEMSMNGILIICNEAYKSSKVDVFFV